MQRLATIWPTLLEIYSDAELFNADETKLFFKLTPHRKVKFKGEIVSAKIITVNMTGKGKGSCRSLKKHGDNYVLKLLIHYRFIMNFITIRGWLPDYSKKIIVDRIQNFL